MNETNEEVMSEDFKPDYSQIAGESPESRMDGEFDPSVVKTLELKPLEPYQERVLQEIEELDQKMSKLKVFLDNGTPNLSFDERALLVCQLDAMKEYHYVLLGRLELWSKGTGNPFVYETEWERSLNKLTVNWIKEKNAIESEFICEQLKALCTAIENKQVFDSLYPQKKEFLMRKKRALYAVLDVLNDPNVDQGE